MSVSNDDAPVFMRPGHNAGDLVEAGRWQILIEETGLVEVEAHLPRHLLNPRNQLFGGFTGTYVDMISLYACRTLYQKSSDFTWSATVNMRIDYLAPVVGPRFRLRGEVISNGRSTCLVGSTFTDLQGNKLVYAITTLRKNA
ncbi:MAG: PaaI family thioesterase [Gammaproteobacteria bacterium]|nr:PaaI family thioesterase [Gammaproteobacteria bacterium]MCY4357988.1 PaaI family thioesterase [Gammaproteobacteria bacterium]